MWAVVGLVFFLPFIGGYELFDWDEINFAESAREMLISGDYGRVTIDFEPFWEKPPLFIWLQALCMRVFGVNEFAARLPNALAGGLTLALLAHFGRQQSPAIGFFWPLLYLGSFLSFFYFKSGIIDPLFNLFMLLSIIAYAASKEGDKFRGPAMAGLWMGLAVLTKGPVGILLPSLAFLGVMVFSPKSIKVTFGRVVTVYAVALLVSCLWFLPETIANGPWFLEEFFRYQLRLASTEDAGHGQPFFYHFVVVLLGMVPASFIAFPKLIPSFKRGVSNLDDPNSLNLLPYMQWAFWVTLILFSLIRTKIVHYSSFTYLPLTFIAATWLASEKGFALKVWQRVSIGVVLGLFGIGFVAVGYGLLTPSKAIQFIGDKVAKANLALIPDQWNGLASLLMLLPGGILGLAGLHALFRKEPASRTLLFIGPMVAFSLLGAGAFILPKIAPLTQEPATNFFRNTAAKEPDALIQPIGYKSYAHLFYGERKVLPDSLKNVEYLLTDTSKRIPKKVYFITRRDRIQNYDSLPNAALFQDLGGFRVYVPKNQLPDR